MKCYEVEECDEGEVDEVIGLQKKFKIYFNNERGRTIFDNFGEYEVNGLIEELKKIADLTIEMLR